MGKINNFISSPYFNLPDYVFTYNPRSPCTFAIQGELMVESLLEITPIFAAQFNQIFNEDLQASLANDIFKKLSDEYKMTHKEKLSLGGKKYFEQNRKFESLIPKNYKRTVVPRISAVGSTFHGMNKTLLINILKEMSLLKKSVFIDVDMSAALVLPDIY